MNQNDETASLPIAPKHSSVSHTIHNPLNTMLANVVEEVRRYAETQSSHIKRLHEIGIALSAEQNLNRLLEKILDEARCFSRADAGTLYIMNNDEDTLEFAIVQNDKMKIRMGGTGDRIDWAPVPLTIGGQPNHANVSSHVALTGEIINIPDVYMTEEFDFSGTRKFDATTGYRCRSMVVIPMRNKAKEIIGVLQLINAIDAATGDAIPFSVDDVTLVSSLASLAAVSITNVRLYQDLERLFESFIVTIATAIDEKSPYTAGHIRRVQELTMAIAQCMNEQTEGAFRDFSLNDNELNELRIAAWLHDIGKIITPEYVVDKATRLEGIHDKVHLVAARFDLLKQEAVIRAQKAKLELLQAGNDDPKAFQDIDEVLAAEEATLRDEKDFVIRCNQPDCFMDSERLERLKSIAGKQGVIDGVETPYLTEQEVINLSVTRGSLTDQERSIIENHALVTLKMLNCLPFPKKLRHVPVYAGYHHEKLDGTGYPFHLAAESLPYQARIIAVADIFEALTAKDRPYKKPMAVSKALQILEIMKNDRHIDPDIFELFVTSGVYRDYAARELDPEQLDG